MPKVVVGTKVQLHADACSHEQKQEQEQKQQQEQ